MTMTFTRTEQRILDILADGKPHLRADLFHCVPDELGHWHNLNIHLSNIRRKLPDGETILCELRSRRICYRHVRLIVPAEGQI